jgi:hypothetical protein
MRETPTRLGPLERAILNHWGLALSKGLNTVSLSSNLWTEIDPISKTLCFLVFRILDDTIDFDLV